MRHSENFERDRPDLSVTNMRLALSAFLGLLLSAFSVQAFAQGQEEKVWIFANGLDLKSHCETNRQFCAGYVASISDSIAVLAQSNRAATICLPQATQLEQIMLVVTKYLSENPDKLHVSAATLASRAIIDAFPCSSGKGRS